MWPVLPLFAIVSIAQASSQESQQIINTDFASAVDVNVCQEKNGGMGPGRTLFYTRACECLGPNTFRAECYRGRPNPREGFMLRYDRACDPRDATVICLPTPDSRDYATDCECKRFPKKFGSKPPHDADGIACSGGVNVPGPRAHLTWSTITVVGQPARTMREILGCWVQGSRAEHLTNDYPCNAKGHVLQFDPKNTYQACIEANDDSPTRINFEWTIGSPWGHKKRDGLEKRLVDQIEYDGSRSTKNWNGSIVLVDEDGVELKRFNA